jgi:type I restriction enzyme, S subunit
MKTVQFDEIIFDETSRFHKIKKENYKIEGKYPILDQGQIFIGGFTNEKKFVNFDVSPFILFGDHTKILKYIDFPFTIGADGVKVLRIDESIANTKYIYYYLKTLKLTEAGYSRHFKFLKNVKIDIPETKLDQIRIATILSQASILIEQRRESLRLLDELLSCIFLEMFGDPVQNEKGWSKIRVDKCADVFTGYAFKSDEYVEDSNEIKLCGGLIISPNSIEWSKANYYPKSKTTLLKKYWLEKDDIVIALDRPWISTGFKIGRIKEIDLPCLLVQRTARVRAFDINKDYLYYSFKHKAFQSHCKPTEATIPHISPLELKNYIIPNPPTELQNEFSEVVRRVEIIREQYEDSLEKLEQLYGSLSQRAFKGELNLDFEIDDKPIYEETLSFNKTEEDRQYTEGLDNITKEIAEFHHSLPHSGADNEIDNKLRQLDTELKIRSEIPYWSEYVKYRLMDERFSYQDLKEVITKFPFDKPPSVEDIQKTITDCLESNPPFLKQVFGHYPLETTEEEDKNPKVIHFIKNNATQTV